MVLKMKVALYVPHIISALYIYLLSKCYEYIHIYHLTDIPYHTTHRRKL